MKNKKLINVQIVKNIREICENIGLIQEKLVDILKIGHKHICAIKRGAVWLSLRISDALSVSANCILFGSVMI